MDKSLKPLYSTLNLVLRVGLEPTHVRLKVLRLNHLVERSSLYAKAYEFKCLYAFICFYIQKYHIWHFLLL